MILPILTYGMPILRVKTRTVEEDSAELQTLIDDMVETMRNASGVGLAAPQVGRSERLFVVDLSAAIEDDEADTEQNGREAGQARDVPSIAPMVFINPEVDLVEGEPVDFEEGCLSIPELREQVSRPDTVTIRFLDRDFEPAELEVSGLLARVIQHEFDHLNGILFVDHLSPLKKRLLRRRLRDMAKGEVSAEYPIVTPVDKQWQPSASIS